MQVNLSIRKLDDKSIVKEERKYITTFEKYVRTDFSLLPHLLSKNYMFSVFAFRSYYRLLENVTSEANLLVLDIDNTSINLKDKFNELKDEGLQIIISSTSNRNNSYKYRILIPLDRTVDVDEYRRLMLGVKQNGLVEDIDMVSPVQIFYSYKDSKILTQFDGNSLIVDDYIIDKQELKDFNITDNTESNLPSSFITDFKGFSTALPGSRTKRLTRAGYLMIEKGYNASQIKKGVFSLNSKLLVPKPKHEVQRRVLDYILKQRK